MARELVIALSPYHLATREAPAMAAVILGDRVVTLLPQPAGGTGRDEVREAVRASPRYLRLMESWRWSSPLWNAGVISSGVDDEEAYGELAGVYESIACEEGLAPLRVLTRGAEERRAESAEKSLDAMAADMLKGGPDPGISMPISAALDRFAGKHGMCVARSGATSLAQKAEQRLGRRVVSIAMPVLLRAGGGRVLMLRNELERELASLRAGLAAVLEEAVHHRGTETQRKTAHRGEPRESAEKNGENGAGLSRAVERVERAAAGYAKAFERWAGPGGGARGDDENAERVTSGYVSVAVMVVPEDVVLRSSRAAIRSIAGGGGGEEMGAARGVIAALVVREMSVKPA